MSGYKIDRTHFTTQAFRYDSFGKYRFEIPISGTLANNTSRQYQLNVSFSDSRVQAKTFITRDDTGLTVPMYIGYRLPSIAGSYEVFQSASGEFAETDQHYEDDGETLVINFFITNTTGSSVNLITQNLSIWIEFYEAPVTWG